MLLEYVQVGFFNPLLYLVVDVAQLGVVHRLVAGEGLDSSVIFVHVVFDLLRFCSKLRFGLENFLLLLFELFKVFLNLLHLV